MHTKHESINDPTLFYCFAIFCKPTMTFQFYIVPSKVVAKYVGEEHQYFRMEQRKEGKKGKDTDIRIFRIGFRNKKYPIDTPFVETYNNNWNLFGPKAASLFSGAIPFLESSMACSTPWRPFTKQAHIPPF